MVFFLTDLVQGDNVTIYLFEPVHKKGQTRLSITKVVHAYKNLFSTMAYGNLGSSEACNNNIACFPDWNLESDAVALVLLSSGTEWCSGSLLMTAKQSFRPYFLSAFHCIDTSNNGVLSETEISNAENWMFKFQYKMTSCQGSNATMGITFNGAEFRAAWRNTDFALMEMNNSPVGDERFSWLGWDRTGNIPISGIGIHHPTGDVMKISFEQNQFQKSNWNGTNNHWLLNFDDGVVEHGSSGSPIFDQNKRVVGQLHGNQNYNSELSYCEQPRAEYGRFDLSWTGGGINATRLSNWLDPTNSGTMATNTSRSPTISGPSTVYTQATYTLNGFDDLPDGATVQWSTSNENLKLVSEQGDDQAVVESNFYGECTIIATISGEGIQDFTITKTVFADINLDKIQYAYIDGPDFVCDPVATFTMHDLPQPSMISWNNNPYTSDTVFTMPVSVYSGNPGIAKVTAKIIYRGKPQQFEHEYYFSFNAPGTRYVEDSVIYNNGVYIDTYNNIANVSVSYLYPAYGINYEWSCNDYRWTLVSGDTDYAEFEGPPDVDKIDVRLCFNNPCGERTCLVREIIIPQYLYQLKLTPNPSTGETTLTIEPINEGRKLDEHVEWELEVYSETQLLKVRQTKLRGRSVKINTQNWHNGAYMVRVRYKDEILTEKLLVKQ